MWLTKIKILVGGYMKPAYDVNGVFIVIFPFFLDLFIKNILQINLTKLFLNLNLFNHASALSIILNRVTLNPLVQLTVTWTSVGISIRTIPPHLFVSKMSHVILIGVTLVWVTSPYWRDSFWVKISSVLFLSFNVFL
jgi:hypothetical protein